jgi:hypothetical protein
MQTFPALLDEVYRTGVPYFGTETAATMVRGEGRTETRYFNFIYSPFRNLGGEIEGVFVVASDVTAQVAAREQVDPPRARHPRGARRRRRCASRRSFGRTSRCWTSACR